MSYMKHELYLQMEDTQKSLEEIDSYVTFSKIVRIKKLQKIITVAVKWLKEWSKTHTILPSVGADLSLLHFICSIETKHTLNNYLTYSSPVSNRIWASVEILPIQILLYTYLPHL
jgi:hypothetical protein